PHDRFGDTRSVRPGLCTFTVVLPDPATPRGRARRAAAPFGSSLLGPADESNRALRVRLQLLTTVAIVAAHIVGVVIVSALNLWVLPRPDALRGDLIVANAVAIPIYLTGALVVGVVWGTRRAFGHVGWILTDERPDADQVRATLRTPIALVGVQAALWAGGGVVFTAISLVVQPGVALNVAVSIVLGGAVTCMAAYLLTEFVMRPIAARALAYGPPDRLAGPGVALRSLLAWTLGSVPVGGLMVIAVLSLVRDDVSADRLAVSILVLGATAGIVGLLLTSLAVRAAVDPMRSLTTAVRAVEGGDLDTSVVVYDGSEAGVLQAAFNRMISGLRERDRVRDLFGRHVGEAVARDALAKGIELGGEVRCVSTLFVDVIGSTELASTRPATEVVDLLNRFFSVVVNVVDQHGGIVNKFEGDGALAVFGAPVEVAQHASAALASARTLSVRLRAEVPECEAGIGVSTGDVVAGNVGEERRYEYTVIGDPVNEAARLCDEAKTVGGRVLVAMRSVESADPGEQALWQEGAAIQLRGRLDVTRTAVPQ
ncbi:MAG: adenylate/guanylate cyclase domain-containing protein, partial [Acidimicrobiales bacterium]|nr:adenylate/guanylate cyclase domain-containing protein [Acidimicrobiales bacterium]